jgi:hypothetical protein
MARALPWIFLDKETKMSEEQTEMPVEEEAQGAAEEAAPEAPEEEATSAKSKANIAEELQQLGRNLTAATKAVLESPEAQEVNTQLHKGLESLEKTVGQLSKQARETSVGKTVETGVSDATAAVKERGLFETLADSFATALHSVNQTLEQSVEKAQTRTEEEKKKRTAPQSIEVVGEQEAPSETEPSEE